MNDPNNVLKREENHMQHLLKSTLVASVFALSLGTAHAQTLAPLNSDSEADRMDWSQLEAKFGAFPAVAEGTRVGGVSKTLTNEYWRSLGEGYMSFAKAHGVEVVYQAAQSEGDQLGQLSIAETLISQGFNALLFSPQSDANLIPALEAATTAGIPVVNVNDAVIPSAAHYVGNVQKDNGARVAQWFIDNHPDGGKVAVIEGQAGVYAAGQRTAGFTETIMASGKFEVVASVPADWSRELAFNAAATILQQHPDLIGFYANNDGMALGVVEAVKAAGKAEQTAVFGTDGISDAYAAVRSGDLTGTVDSFPVLTGEVAMEVALRLLAGQALPRVVATPQALITKDNVETYATTDMTALRAALMAK
jgi:ribose transport system substrate-binding protein